MTNFEYFGNGDGGEGVSADGLQGGEGVNHTVSIWEFGQELQAIAGSILSQVGRWGMFWGFVFMKFPNWVDRVNQLRPDHIQVGDRSRTRSDGLSMAS